MLGALRPHEIEKERRKQDDKRIREIRKALAARRPQILPLHGSPQKVSQTWCISLFSRRIYIYVYVYIPRKLTNSLLVYI